MASEPSSADPVGKGKPESNSNSSLNSEEYEMIPAATAHNTTATAGGEEAPDQSEPKQEGRDSLSPPALDVKVADLEGQLKECISPEEEEESNSSGQKGVSGDGMLNNSRNLDEDIEHTVFHNITYLGWEAIKDPKNEATIQEQIARVSSIGVQVPDTSGETGHFQNADITLSVPRNADGFVIMRDSETSEELQRFPVCRIIFFSRGSLQSDCASCFAFTCVHFDHAVDKTKEVRHFHTHICRCDQEEAVKKVFVSFSKAFKKAVPIQVGQKQSFDEQEAFHFEINLEIKEKDEAKNVYDHVPRQKGLFKLRSNVEKKVVISVQQISRNSIPLQIERCFGMLVSPGRNVRHADMQLLENVTMATGAPDECGGIVHVITGSWDPSDTVFAVLNRETPSDIQSVYVTIAADLVIQQVSEPVRFIIETKARIYPTNERYWYYARRSLCKQYQLRLKRLKENSERYEVCGIEVSEEVERNKNSFTSQLANLTWSTFGSVRNPASVTSPTSSTGNEMPLASPTLDAGGDDESSGDEAMLSGYGDVSKECSGTELDQWREVLEEWDADQPLNFPKQLPGLVKKGIPEALRGEVWQRVTGASVQMNEIVETYRILTTKESPDDKVILRDIHRTFPAHEFFKESGGIGQESLYRIAKAYSVYDSEIGYCQGQSFLIAAFLLQMPEEQAFGVLVKVMHRWGLRDMFKENFEQLQLRLYQLDRLVETNLPDLWQHFCDNGIESHMYASQWFLTIFTAKFPLFLVFRVLDCFLLFGFDCIFQVALGILKVSKKDLLLLDFEGLMRYFRVNIPKRYRSEENAKHLMAVATGIKLKKLNKYEKEWLNIKAQERARENPVVRLERENKKLLSDNMRLDTENDNLARQLVSSKIEMRKEIDRLEDEKDLIEKESSSTKVLLDEATEEKKRLEMETEQLKGLLKREVSKMDIELMTRNNVIEEYKRKLEKAEKAKSDEALSSNQNAGVNNVEEASDIKSANDRIKELELELAQTKLALVETECKFQDIMHQASSWASSSSSSSGQSSSKTWLSKTLTSIRESAHAQLQFPSGPSAAPPPTAGREPIKKSTSVDAFGH